MTDTGNALILHLETSSGVCSVALSKGTELISLRELDEKNIHSSRLTIFVKEVMQEAGLELKQLDAISVGEGPGSYTGLRIGVATAKGLCYALDKPLIAVNSLRAMSGLAVMESDPRDMLYCPMTDARRMEVYCALFDRNKEEIKKTAAEIITGDSFRDDVHGRPLCFFGDGAGKCVSVMTNSGFIFRDGIRPSAKGMLLLAADQYHKQVFQNIAYFQPLYLKEFVSHAQH